jgi:1-acyl-sn-glycerol-3-phosphate acyltransferase
MLRTICGVAAALIYLIFWIPVLGIEYLISRKNKEKADLQCLHMVQWILRVIYRICGVKLTVKGREHIPKDQAVLYVCNHQSYFDIIIGYTLVPSRTGYIAKDDLARIPILRIWMKRLYCLFLNRDNPRESLKTIKTATEQIRQGISMCIFPEGTRGDGITLQPFKEGSLKMAERTNCPVIPMAISNTSAILKDHMPFVKPAHVIVEYGEPIDPSVLSREEKHHMGHMAQERIQSMLDRNRAEL